MKKLLLSAMLIAFAFASCKKQKSVVNPPDTTIHSSPIAMMPMIHGMITTSAVNNNNL